MSGRHLSVRVSDELLQHLEAQSRRDHATVSDTARRLIEEGLRMESHPGIVFRQGPGGRRAGLSEGPDIWEVIQDFRDWKDDMHPADERVGASSLYPHQIRKALAYYADFSAEIEELIQVNQEQAERSHKAWSGRDKAGAAPAYRPE